MNRSIIGALLAAGLCGALSAGAAPSDIQDVPRVTVRYGDLDLTTEVGARKLYRRLVAAAGVVCPYPGQRDLGAAIAAHACRDAAVERAVHEINRATLAAELRRHSRAG